MLNSIYQWAVKAISNITTEQWKAVLSYVKQIASREMAGEDKRAWVIDKLKNLGITGARANFLIEAAVMLSKRLGIITQ